MRSACSSIAYSDVSHAPTNSVVLSSSACLAFRSGWPLADAKPSAPKDDRQQCRGTVVQCPGRARHRSPANLADQRLSAVRRASASALRRRSASRRTQRHLALRLASNASSRTRLLLEFLKQLRPDTALGPSPAAWSVAALMHHRNKSHSTVLLVTVAYSPCRFASAIACTSSALRRTPL